MKLTKFTAAAALAFAVAAGPALAQDAGVTVGATIYGPQGNPVGTVEKIEGGNVFVNTGNLSAALPSNVFSKGENGPTIGWNKTDLEAAVTSAQAEAKAAFDAALVAGAQLYSVDGILLGTVDEVGPAGLVTVALTDAEPVKLPKDQMSLQGEKLTFLATAADLKAALSAQAGASAEADTSSES